MALAAIRLMTAISNFDTIVNPLLYASFAADSQYLFVVRVISESHVLNPFRYE